MHYRWFRPERGLLSGRGLAYKILSGLEFKTSMTTSSTPCRLFDRTFKRLGMTESKSAKLEVEYWFERKSQGAYLLEVIVFWDSRNIGEISTKPYVSEAPAKNELIKKILPKLIRIIAFQRVLRLWKQWFSGWLAKF